MSATTREVRPHAEARTLPFPVSRPVSLLHVRMSMPAELSGITRHAARGTGRHMTDEARRLAGCTMREEPMPGVHDLNEEQYR